MLEPEKNENVADDKQGRFEFRTTSTGARSYWLKQLWKRTKDKVIRKIITLVQSWNNEFQLEVHLTWDILQTIFAINKFLFSCHTFFEKSSQITIKMFKNICILKITANVNEVKSLEKKIDKCCEIKQL